MIEFRGLTKRFGATLAVDNLTASVASGSVTAFLGPNGAGKTTTLRVLLGLVAPTAGAATIDGQRYAGTRGAGASGRCPPRSFRVPPRPHGTRPPAQPGCRGPAAGGRSRAGAFRGGPVVRSERGVGDFSLGMRQRLGLAAAILGDPPVLVLDEPANGLDPQGILWLRGYLRELADGGRTVLVSSHALAEVEQIADDVLMIARGRLVRSTSLGELRREAGVAAGLRSPQIDRLQSLIEAAGYPFRRVGRDELVVDGVAPELLGELAAEHKVVLHRLYETRGLEEIFLRLTGDDHP